MLTPNELEAIPEPLVKLFRQLELDVMNDIIERIAVNKDISRTADWEISRLYELGVSKRAIKKRIKDALKLSTREINLIYKNVIWQDYARYEPIYRTKGKPWIPYEKNRQLQQLRRHARLSAYRGVLSKDARQRRDGNAQRCV